MKRVMQLLVVVVLSGVLAIPAFAEITPGKYSISPFVGQYKFDKDMHVKDEMVYGVRLGYDVTKHCGVEGAFDYVKSEMNEGLGGKVNVYGYRLDGLYHFRSQEKLVPFVAAGIGGTRSDVPSYSNGESGHDFLFNYGAGVKYFLSQAFALRADIRHLLVLDGGRQDWEYTVGLSFLFGGKKAAPVAAPVAAIDSDGDGVADSLDKCPNTPKGVSVDKDGCPVDSDGDGVADYLDKCPATPKGDKVDPSGCTVKADTDSDGDGVLDTLDKCPNTPKGEKVDKDGCPLDSDGDGVADSADKCPNTPKGEKVGPDGCPVKAAEKAPEKVSIALEIEFDTSKADIKAKYHDQIKKVADFMTTYPGTTAVIEGHTDNVGKEESNKALSLKRAESVKTYLVEKFGVAAGSLKAKGFGSSQPVADNATPEGRQKNRRINAVFETTKR